MGIQFKKNNRGEIIRYKARLVARGFSQVRGESYDETFSPVIDFTIIRLFFSIFVCKLNWVSLQLDVNNAYLYAELDANVYMKQPTGFEVDDRVCKLNKAIYGLHQSGRQWYFELEGILTRLGFLKLDWTNCVFTYNSNIFIMFYVDDLVLIAKEQNDIDSTLVVLQKNFELKIIGKTKKLLGIEFEYIENKILIHQQSYINELCKQYTKYNIPICSLPISKGIIFSTQDSPQTVEEYAQMKEIPYRNLIGSLAFIAGRTRPDISFAVNIFSQFQANPGMKHWLYLLKVLGYLRYTQEYMLDLSNVDKFRLEMFTDADYASNRDDRVSMGGYILYIDRTPITWKTFKHRCITLSTMESEYISMAESAKELVWLKGVLEDKNLKVPVLKSTLYCDNLSAISFSKSPIQNSRSKHIDIKYHFIRKLISDEIFEIKSVKSKENPADIFTKPQVKEHLLIFCREIFKIIRNGKVMEC